jgi:hypothetical protein
MGDIYYDISGMLGVQNKYLTDLSFNTTGDNTRDFLNTQLINTNLNNISNSLTTNTAPYILSQQDKVLDVINTELSRLEIKKQSIDGAESSQKRLALFNETYRKRYKQYTKIVLILFFTIVLCIIISVIQSYIFFIPEVLYILVYSIIISVAIIWSIRVYFEILNRDSINYDQIHANMSTPSAISGTAVSNDTSGNLLGTVDLGNCYDSSCCSTGTIWDKMTHTCIIKTTDTTTDAFTVGKNINPTKPYNTTEFIDYTLI